MNVDAMELHKISEYYANLAQISGSHEELAIAARLEEDAVTALMARESVPFRTLSIFAVSAAAMYFRLEELDKAGKLCHEYLKIEGIQPFAVDQLKEMLYKHWL